MDSALILEKKLHAAQRDIEVLRQLVDYTVAMIVAAGGRIDVPADKVSEWSKRPWRHENDGVTHTFTTAGA